MHALLVDDKQPILSQISSFLAELGFKVETASNGLDGQEKATKGAFDLYIIDHLMPVMNGIQLTKNLKGKDKTADTPVLFMTTQDLNQVEKLAEYSLFDAVITKPIDKELFFDVVNQLIPQNTRLQSL